MRFDHFAKAQLIHELTIAIRHKKLSFKSHDSTTDSIIILSSTSLLILFHLQSTTFSPLSEHVLARDLAVILP